MGRILAVSAVLLGGAIVIGILATSPPPARIVPKRAEKPPPPTREEKLRAEQLPEVLTPLLQVAQPKLPSGPGDWLTEHPEEGQSLAQHRVDCTPVMGRTVYLVPTSELEEKEAAQKIFATLEPLLAAHFQLPVKRLPALSAKIAGKSERINDYGPQWLTGDILEALKKVKPADAAAVMAITSVDLYPDPEWNFVFGAASYDERVGVMSIARSGELEVEPQPERSRSGGTPDQPGPERSEDLGRGEAIRTKVLERSYATAMHEVGHMFQIAHCVAWECPMNGCNHQEEADSRPVEPCPHCLAKLMRATGLDPQKRWTELRAAFAAAGLTRGVKEIDRELSSQQRADGGLGLNERKEGELPITPPDAGHGVGPGDE